MLQFFLDINSRLKECLLIEFKARDCSSYVICFLIKYRLAFLSKFIMIKDFQLIW